MDRRMFFKQSATMFLAASAWSGVTPGEIVPTPGTEIGRYFPGFKPLRIETSAATINGVIGGSGPPLLLLHGWPQTHLIWHKLAVKFASSYTVIATDLRGYGDSSKPSDGEKHSGYSKRAMAADQMEVMSKLGFERFAVVGHDRGGRVAHRLALDHPQSIVKLAVLDIVPTYKLYNTITKDLATVYFHWFFLIQPAPLPETLLSNNAEFFLRNWAFGGLIPKFISEEIFSEYLRHFQNPATLHALCEDYRAGASIDLEHDQADLDKKVECPVLALWGTKGAMGSLYDVLSTWKERASNVQGKAIESGHYLPEESPDELYRELISFLSEAKSVNLSTMKNFAAHYTAAWCSQDPSRVSSFFAENGSLTINNGAPSIGRTQIRAAADGFMKAFPDMIVKMNLLEQAGERFIYHWRLTGTNTGPGGAGKKVDIQGYEEWTIGEDGLILQSQGHFDEAEYQRQLHFGASE